MECDVNSRAFFKSAKRGPDSMPSARAWQPSTLRPQPERSHDLPRTPQKAASRRSRPHCRAQSALRRLHARGKLAISAI
eukprot:4771706-Pyramimonas_sp.AAC.1